MMKLPDPMAFDVLGRPVAPTAAPVLRIIGGEASEGQIGAARHAFQRHLMHARLSVVPNPVEQGRLPDGAIYKIITVGSVRTMLMWPGVEDEGKGSDCIPLVAPVESPSYIEPPVAPRLPAGYYLHYRGYAYATEAGEGLSQVTTVTQRITLQLTDDAGTVLGQEEVNGSLVITVFMRDDALWNRLEFDELLIPIWRPPFIPSMVYWGWGGGGQPPDGVPPDAAAFLDLSHSANAPYAGSGGDISVIEGVYLDAQSTKNYDDSGIFITTRESGLKATRESLIAAENDRFDTEQSIYDAIMSVWLPLNDLRDYLVSAYAALQSEYQELLSRGEEGCADRPDYEGRRIDYLNRMGEYEELRSRL